MTWTYADTISASWQANEVERRQALADVDSAHLREDWTDLQHATDRLRRADEEARWLSEKANNLYQQQQRAQMQQPNQFGLSRREQEIAESSFIDRPDLPRFTTEQKHRMYRANRDKYHAMRQSGQYDDTQGRVRR